jgi:hypothetical protein
MAAAALLTTRRLMLVGGDLKLIAAIDASCGASGVAHPISSVLWAGPALLYMTAGGQAGFLGRGGWGGLDEGGGLGCGVHGSVLPEPGGEAGA